MLTTEREAETYEEVDTIVFTDYFREAFVFTSILLKSPSVPRAPPRDAPAGTPSVSHAGHVNRRGLRVVQRVRAFGVVGGHERVGVLRDAAKRGWKASAATRAPAPRFINHSFSGACERRDYRVDEINRGVADVPSARWGLVSGGCVRDGRPESH